MDITPDLGISFNDLLFSKKTWKFVSSFEYEKTFPIYIKIISNSFNKHVLLIQYENGNSELKDWYEILIFLFFFFYNIYIFLINIYIYKL